MDRADTGDCRLSSMCLILMQSISLSIDACYPHYAASGLAVTDFTRSDFACGAVIFSRPLYFIWEVGPGCRLLAGLTAGRIVGIYAPHNCDEATRKRSKSVAKW